jgi:hypothetical protein
MGLVADAALAETMLTLAVLGVATAIAVGTAWIIVSGYRRRRDKEQSVGIQQTDDRRSDGSRSRGTAHLHGRS